MASRTGIKANQLARFPGAALFTFADSLEGHISTKSAWAKIGDAGVGSPACTPLGTGQVVCVIMGIDNKLSSVVGP